MIPGAMTGRRGQQPASAQQRREPRAFRTPRLYAETELRLWAPVDDDVPSGPLPEHRDRGSFITPRLYAEAPVDPWELADGWESADEWEPVPAKVSM